MIKIFKKYENNKAYTGKVIIIGPNGFEQSQDHQFIKLYKDGARIWNLRNKHITTEYCGGSTS